MDLFIGLKLVHFVDKCTQAIRSRLLTNMTDCGAILRKVKSLPTLIRKQKSTRKLEKICDSIPLPSERPPSRPRNWLFLEHCQLLEHLVDHFIALHKEDKGDGEENRTWYWANNFDEEYPMTYQPDNNSMVSNSLLRDQRLDSSFEVPLTNGQQTTLTRYFRTYRPPQRI